MTKKLPVSVIILTHRHDRRFQRAVESAAFTQEVKIITLPGPISDFAQARNQALDEVNSEWVFFLDSDEIITSESVGVIETMIARPDIDGVWVRRKDIFFNRVLQYGEVGQVRLLRLARKSKLLFLRPVHEVAEVSGSTTSADIMLLHESHQSCQEFIEKVAGYAKQEAKFRHNGGQVFSPAHLAMLPLAKWWQNALFRLGFLDGWRGMTYVFCMVIHSLLVRIYLYELETIKTPNN